MTSQESTSVSFSDILASQTQLEAEAAEAIPFSFSTCTYGIPDLEDRQPIYSCLSCRPTPTLAEGTSSGSSNNGMKDEDRAGICVGCSVACHGDCELVELFSRKNFVCDCGTTRISRHHDIDHKGKGKSRKCNLTLRENDTPSQDNKYDANFDGVFCECSIKYDPETEEDEMIQCLVCEDWYHLSKCLLSGITKHPDQDNEDDLLHPDDFDQLVCEKCVLGPARSTVGRYAGRKGFMLLGPDGRLPLHEVEQAPEKEEAEDGAQVEEEGLEVTSKQAKRARSAGVEAEEQASKKAKLEKDTAPIVRCRAPPEHNALLEEAISGTGGRKHVFLAEGWRERWCKCESCLPLYSSQPYLLTEESVYSPPSDPDSQKSLLELGETALSKMPREQAIQGIEAYNGMRDRLKEYLEPFAREGKVVGREDVERFFQEQRENLERAGR